MVCHNTLFPLTKAESEWEMMEQIVTGDVHTVMAQDSLTSSHPINVRVLGPNDINQIFDPISYNKGNFNGRNHNTATY